MDGGIGAGISTPFAARLKRDWHEGEKHLHHIFLRPKSGAVRFEYGDKTIHFADSLDPRRARRSCVG